MNNRRKLVIALGAGALLMPMGSIAQQPATGLRRIGFLNTGHASAMAGQLKAFRDGLRDLGYVEGKNLIIEFRWADGKADRLPALAAELAQMKVAAILASSSLGVQAARQATASIPIVMTGVGNPVGSGFVASLAHPGGNVTGVSNVSIDISSKYLELLHEAAPKLSRVAVLISPVHPNHPAVLKQIQAGAKALGIVVSPVEVRTIDEMGAALTAVLKARAGALIVPPDPTFQIKGREIAEFALKKNLPTMFGTISSVDDGGLMGYAANNLDSFRSAGALIAKILNGAKPGDLPVELPTRFELAINLKTAKALGLTIPQSLMVRAEKVIK